MLPIFESCGMSDVIIGTWNKHASITEIISSVMSKTPGEIPSLPGAELWSICFIVVFAELKSE